VGENAHKPKRLFSLPLSFPLTPLSPNVLTSYLAKRYKKQLTTPFALAIFPMRKDYMHFWESTPFNHTKGKTDESAFGREKKSGQGNLFRIRGLHGGNRTAGELSA
jgi:hypothetical protein